MLQGNNCVPVYISALFAWVVTASYLLLQALLSLLVCVSASSLHFWKSLPESCLVTWVFSCVTDRPLESCRGRCCHPSSLTCTPQTCVTTLKGVISRRMLMTLGCIKQRQQRGVQEPVEELCFVVS